MASTDIDSRAAPVLARLGLVVDGRGIVSRPHRATSGASLVSLNPANGRPLGSVATATAGEFDGLLAETVEAAREWRDTPAPVRGNAVRRYAERLREHKDALGTLVSLETG